MVVRVQLFFWLTIFIVEFMEQFKSRHTLQHRFNQFQGFEQCFVFSVKTYFQKLSKRSKLTMIYLIFHSIVGVILCTCFISQNYNNYKIWHVFHVIPFAFRIFLLVVSSAYLCSIFSIPYVFFQALLDHILGDVNIYESFEHYDKILRCSRNFFKVYSFNIVLKIFMSVEIFTVVIYQSIGGDVLQGFPSGFTVSFTMCALWIDLPTVLVFFLCNKLNRVSEMVSSTSLD